MEEKRSKGRPKGFSPDREIPLVKKAKAWSMSQELWDWLESQSNQSQVLRDAISKYKCDRANKEQNMANGFWVDESNFSGKNDLFQVMEGKSRRLTFEGEKYQEIDETWNIENFHSGTSSAHPDFLLDSIPDEFRDRFRISDPGSTSPTYTPNGEPRRWGDYGYND